MVSTIRSGAEVTPQGTPTGGIPGPEEQRPGTRTVRSPARNIALNLLRQAVAFACSVATSVIIARRLGVDAMGSYAFVLWVSGLLVGFAHFGLPTALTRFIAEYRGRNEAASAARVARALLLMQFASTLVVTLAGGVILRLTTSLTPRLLLLALLLAVPLVMQQAFAAALMGTESYARMAWAGSLGSVIQVILVVAAAVWSGTVLVFLSAMVIACFAAAALSFFILMRELPTRPATSSGGPEWREVMRFAAPVAYLVLLDMVVWQRSEIFFLKRYSAIQEIAFYSIAFLIVNRITEIAVSATSTLLPMQSHQAGADPRQLPRSHSRALLTLQMAIVPLCLAAAALARPAVQALYGESYLPAVPVLLVLLLSPIAVTLTSTGVAAIYASGKQKALIAPTTATALLNIALAMALVPRLGALGAAISGCTAQLAEAAFVLIYSSRILQIAVPWISLLRCYAAAILCFSPALIADRLGLGLPGMIIALLVSAVGYISAMVWFGEICHDDWTALRMVFLRRADARAV